MLLASFLLFLAGFTFVGIMSSKFGTGTKQDYYLASNSIKPWLAGLSAFATNSSGYMFIGVIGYTYTTGLSAIWLMIGWITGDFLASLFIHRKMQVKTGETGEVSYGGLLSNWNLKQAKVQKVIGILSLFFLSTYATAQLVAGSKALHVLFDWPIWAGAIMGAVLVVVYCIAGGIRASIWTDAAQSFVMLAAMTILVIVSVSHFGGVNESIQLMNQLPGFLDIFPKDLAFPGVTGGVMFVVGWLFAGFTVVGQPHIMSRFMTLGKNESMVATKSWYYGWFVVFWFLATVVGLFSRIYLTDTGAFDAELALPTMALEMLPAPLTGLVLAGIFAATMSTADSLVLSCSATITQDFGKKLNKPIHYKFATIGITLFVLVLALMNNQSVFDIVIMSWSVLGSAFSPLLIVLALGKKPSEATSLSAIFVGVLTVVLWRYFGLQGMIFEGFPAVLAGLIVLMVGLQFSKSKTAE
ncbi:MAG: sodium/proline symporter [Fibrobacterales bacterium]